MIKEFVCKECGGHATKEYYQENPDCKQCPEYEGCSGATNGHCIISSKDTCPSCQDGHIPLSEMLMMVNEALCRANECFRNGFVETGNPDFAFTGLMSAEHFLALAVVRLREIAEVMGIAVYKPAYPKGDLDLHMIADVSRFIGYIIHGFMKYFDWGDIDSFDMSSVIECINIFCDHHKIPLEKHIETLIAYEKESE